MALQHASFKFKKEKEEKLLVLETKSSGKLTKRVNYQLATHGMQIYINKLLNLII